MTSPHDAQQPEYLDQRPAPDPSGRRPRRRTAVLAAVSLGVLAVLGVGGWGVAQFLSGGSSPASAVPSSAVGYLSVDLDPSAGQKIEAIKLLHKFPGLRKQLDLGSRDDLRRWVFDRVQQGHPCTSVDYDTDIAPWIGERIALAAVPQGKDSAFPLLAVQENDEQAARAAVKKLDACAGGDQPTGVAFSGDYLLLTETQAEADQAAKATAAGSLADDPGYKTWTDRVGEPGVITGYASADAPRLLARLQGGPMHGGWTAYSGVSRAPLRTASRLDPLYKNFAGAAGVVRFHDGAVETEVVSQGLPAGAASTATGPDVRTLPASTALAFSVGLKHGWLADYVHSMKNLMGGGPGLDDAFRQGEAATGLRLPQDIETLLGDGVSVSFDSSVDLGALAKSPDPSQVPLGLRIKGDPAKITAVIDKLKAIAGPEARLVLVKQGDGMVVVGLQRSYVDQLLQQGALGSTTTFQDAVPHADQAGSVFYVNFDAGNGWAEKLGDLASDNDPQVRANLAPLQALGISGWQDADGVQHALLRLTTD